MILRRVHAREDLAVFAVEVDALRDPVLGPERRLGPEAPHRVVVVVAVAVRVLGKQLSCGAAELASQVVGQAGLFCEGQPGAFSAG